jgi:hypothetical protein
LYRYAEAGSSVILALAALAESATLRTGAAALMNLGAPELILGLCMDDRLVVGNEQQAAAAIALGMLMSHGVRRESADGGVQVQGPFRAEIASSGLELKLLRLLARAAGGAGLSNSKGPSPAAAAAGTAAGESAGDRNGDDGDDDGGGGGDIDAEIAAAGGGDAIAIGGGDRVIGEDDSPAPLAFSPAGGEAPDAMTTAAAAEDDEDEDARVASPSFNGVGLYS